MHPQEQLTHSPYSSAAFQRRKMKIIIKQIILCTTYKSAWDLLLSSQCLQWKFNIITPFTVAQFKSRHHHRLAYSKDSSPCRTHGRVQCNSFSTAVWLVLFSYHHLILSFNSIERMRIKRTTLLFLEAII